MTSVTTKSAGTRSLRVLEIETFGRGGLAHYVANLSSSLAELGHQVTLLTTQDYELENDGPLGRAESSDVSVLRRLARATARFRSRTDHNAPARRQRVARKFEAIFDAFGTAVFTWRTAPDVVHLHCTNPIALLYLALLRLASLLRLGKIRVIATAHQVTPHEEVIFERHVSGLSHRLCHLIIAHSYFDKKRLNEEFEVAQERVAVIPHGEYSFFDQIGIPPTRSAARQTLGLEPSDEIALFFGYLREYKGLVILFDAWPTVAQQRPHARLVVAGDPVQLHPKQLQELKERAQQLRVLARFEYIPLTEVSQYFRAADVLALPYRKISQSGVLYLGLALGLPVLATRIGPWAELLSDQKDALLVAPESAAELSGGLVRLLGDASLRESLAQGGRRLAQEHSWPKIARKTEAAFALALSKTAGD